MGGIYYSLWVSVAQSVKANSAKDKGSNPYMVQPFTHGTDTAIVKSDSNCLHS